MSFESELISWLQGHGSITGDFYFEDADPDASLPFCQIDVTNRTVTYYAKASSRGKSSLSHIEIDFNCYGVTSLAANALGDELLSVLENFKGDIPGNSPATHIENALKTADFNDREAQTDSYYRTITMIIGYR